MRHSFLFLALLLSGFGSLAAQTPEHDAVKATIQRLFAGMYAADTAMIRSTLHPEAQLHTATTDRNGQLVLVNTPIQNFVAGAGTRRPQPVDEKLWNWDIRIDQNLATVWTEYSLFLGSQFSHCGYDAFQLVKVAAGWKIFQITDTRRKEGCHTTAPNPQAELATLIDGWHAAAARADADAYFGAMTSDAVFLGTDASERWLRDAMRRDLHEAFSRGKAWDFKSHDRTILLSANGQMAWWDELLDTWMGPCRGSGVALLTPTGWKIQHYNLAIMVPNAKVQAFLELMKK